MSPNKEQMSTFETTIKKEAQVCLQLLWLFSKQVLEPNLISNLVHST